MPFIAQGKTNLKYILIVVVLAVIVGGGVLILATKQELPFQIPGITSSEKTGCDWRPTNDYGPCMRVLGYYYTGEGCVSLSGCGSKDDKIPFSSVEECRAGCAEDETANWKTSSNDELQFSIQYPVGTLLPRSACDSFVLASSEDERNTIKNIRDKGIEIGYTVEGLELGFCIITPGGQSLTLDDIKNYQSQGIHTNITFAGREAIQVKLGKFTEMYIDHPSSEIMRIWYRYGDDSYKEIAIKMLSTFKFLE